MAAKKSARGITESQAEKQTKVAAKKRRIVIELTEEQLAGLTAQYSKLNPAEAAELVFTVKQRPTSKLKIAGYSYSGSTCCA